MVWLRRSDKIDEMRSQCPSSDDRALGSRNTALQSTMWNEGLENGAWAIVTHWRGCGKPAHVETGFQTFGSSALMQLLSALPNQPSRPILVKRPSSVPNERRVIYFVNDFVHTKRLPCLGSCGCYRSVSEKAALEHCQMEEIVQRIN